MLFRSSIHSSNSVAEQLQWPTWQVDLLAEEVEREIGRLKVMETRANTVANPGADGEHIESVFADFKAMAEGQSSEVVDAPTEAEFFGLFGDFGISLAA